MKRILGLILLLTLYAGTAFGAIPTLDNFNRLYFTITTSGAPSNVIKVALSPSQFTVTTNGITLTNISGIAGSDVTISNLFSDLSFITTLFSENISSTNGYFTYLVSSNLAALNWQGTTNTLVMFGPDGFSGQDSIVTQSDTNAITIYDGGDGILNISGSGAILGLGTNTLSSDFSEPSVPLWNGNPIAIQNSDIFITTNLYSTFQVTSNLTALNIQGNTNTIAMFGPDTFSLQDSIITQDGTNSISINAPGAGFLTFGPGVATITAEDGFVFSNGSNTILSIQPNSGYSGTGTNVLKDDGSFGQWVGGSDGTNTTVVQLGPFTVDTYPVANATNTLTDGNLYRVGSTNVGINSQLVFGPGTTNTLYRSGGNFLQYGDGAGSARFYITNTTSSKYGYIGWGSGEYDIGTSAATIGLINATKSIQFNAANLYPNSSDVNLGASGVEWNEFWGTKAYIKGFSSGADYSRLAISHSGTNAATGGAVFDLQTSGTAGVPRKFSFQSNSVEFAKFTPTSLSFGAGSAQMYWDAAGDASAVQVYPATAAGSGGFIASSFSGDRSINLTASDTDATGFFLTMTDSSSSSIYTSLWPSNPANVARIPYQFSTVNYQTNVTQAVPLFLVQNGYNSTVPSTNDMFAVSPQGPIILAHGITKAQKTAIANPQNGMMVYQTDNTPGIRAYINGAWVMLSTAADP